MKFLVFLAAITLIIPAASAYHQYGFESDFYDYQHQPSYPSYSQGYDTAYHHGLYNYPQVQTYSRPNYYRQVQNYQAPNYYPQQSYNYYPPRYDQGYSQPTNSYSNAGYSVVGHPTYNGFYNWQPFQRGSVITDYYS